MCLCSFTAADSYQMFFKIEGVRGGTAYQGEIGWINVLTWQWAAGRSILASKPLISVTSSSYTGPSMESVESLDGLGIKFSKWVDKSSPDLIQAFEKKIRIPSAKLCLLSVVGEKETTWTYELKNVMVTSHAQEGNRETVTLNYDDITWGKK